MVHHLKRTHPELIPPAGAAIDGQSRTQVPAAYKRDLLGQVMRVAGMGEVFAIGGGIGDLGYDPVWQTAMRAASPSVLFAAWQRFEVFAHSRNRLRIEYVAPRRAVFHRHTVTGGTPSGPENVFVCGLMVALLREIGCTGVRCDMPLANGTSFPVLAHGRIALPSDPAALATATWTISWRTFVSRAAGAPLAGVAVPSIPLPWRAGSAHHAAITAAIGLLAFDVTRQWQVGELAAAVGMSTRSLQRRLHEAGQSFSSLVRMVRLNRACQLLERSDTPITAVGFCAGFSDSAHFSRDFRAGVGLTPSAFRSVC